jgi:hypothetical protein
MLGAACAKAMHRFGRFNAGPGHESASIRGTPVFAER